MKRVLLILALCAGLCACGRSENATQTADQPQPTTTEQTAKSDVSSKLNDTIANIEALANDKKYEEAFRAIVEAEISNGRSEQLSSLFERVYDATPQYNATPRHLVTDQDISVVKKLGGGSSLVYRLIKDKQTFAAFKPKQKRKQSNPRSELAAYRLCPLIRCRFDIPKNEPIWFEYKQFSGLYARLPSNPQKELTDLDLVKIDNMDRVEGTMKDWVPSFAEFPIEIESLWKPWFEMTKAELQNKPAIEAVMVVAETNKRAEALSTKLKSHMERVSAYDIALQLSNLIVFDFLINNWDRYSVKAEFYGVNCQFANGRFMSIDNGASFPQKANRHPAERLHAIKRFSRLTYESIKALDKDKTLQRLFPSSTSHEEERFNTFWSQRALYLEYVDKLVEENGAEQVFLFE